MYDHDAKYSIPYDKDASFFFDYFINSHLLFEA